MDSEELRKLLDHKFVIFDTNILLKALDHFEAFVGLVKFLRSCNCRGVCFPLIEFEFLNGKFTPQHIKQRKDFLDLLADTHLPIGDSLIEQAVKISRVYAHQKVDDKKVELVDCCIAAYLKQYSKRLFLITLNHRHYPTVLFDRLHVLPIEDGNEVFVPAFYSFNEQKWKVLEEKISKLYV